MADTEDEIEDEEPDDEDGDDDLDDDDESDDDDEDDYDYDSDDDGDDDDDEDDDSQQFMTAEEIADLQVGDRLVWRWGTVHYWTEGQEYEVLRVHGDDNFDLTSDHGEMTTDHEGFALVPRPVLGGTSLVEDILQGLG